MQPIDDIQELKNKVAHLESEFRKLTEPLSLTVERQYFDSAMKEIRDKLDYYIRNYGDLGVMHSRHIADLHEDVRKLNAQMLSFRESQADMRDTIQRIEATMATKQEMTQLRTEIKADMSAMKNEILSAIQHMLQDKG